MKFEIIRYKNVKSTQNIANNLAKKGMKEGIVIITERQSCGKGRNNNNWFSPKGGLWLSIILRPQNKINFTQLFGLIIAYLISSTIKDVTKIRTTIKLPNDILINKKKVCGILQEMIFKNDKKFLIIGIGINIINSPKVTKYETTYLNNYSKKKINKIKLFKEIIFNYEKNIKFFRN